MRNRILAATVTVLALASASCGEDCIPYDAGDTRPRFVGSYESEQTATLQNCFGIEICQGPTTVGVFLDEQGEFVVGKTDCNGNYYELDGGQVCTPTEAGYYRVLGHVSDLKNDPKVNYNISLTLNENANPPTIQGTLTMSVSPSGGQPCTLTGRISGTCIDCVGGE